MMYRLSLQTPPAPWEYYICKQLQERIIDPTVRSVCVTLYFFAISHFSNIADFY